VAQRPWQGFGFGALWHEPLVPPTTEIVQRIGFAVGHAHNGAIEIMLEVGLIGLALYAWLFGHTLMRALRQIRRSQVASWISLLCLVQFFLCLDEPMVWGGWLALLSMLSVLSVDTDSVPETRRTPIAIKPPTLRRSRVAVS
jgi:O-antigen ligase